MDALNQLQSLVEAPIQVSVNGQPLSQTLQTIVSAIQDQAQQLAQLQSYTYATNAEQWNRISALESSVARLDADIGINSRPLLGGKQTAHEALTSLEERTTLLEAHRKVGQSNNLQELSEKILAVTYFRKLQKYQEIKKAVAVMNGGSNQELYSRYFRKMKRYVQLKATLIRRDRAIRAIVFGSAKSLISHYFNQWTRHNEIINEKLLQKREFNVGCAESMATVTMRGLVRRYFINWERLVIIQRQRDAIHETIFGMQQIISRKLAFRYFSQWMAAEAMNRHRRFLNGEVRTLASRSGFNLGKRILQTWARWSRRRARHRVASSFVPRMHHMQCIRLALRYFGRLQRFQHMTNDRRRAEEGERKIAAVMARCDGIAKQLDVGLLAIQRTNATVLQLASGTSAMAGGSVDNEAGGKGDAAQVQRNLRAMLAPAAASSHAHDAYRGSGAGYEGAPTSWSPVSSPSGRGTGGSASTSGYPPAQHQYPNNNDENSDDDETEQRIAALMEKAHAVARLQHQL